MSERELFGRVGRVMVDGRVFSGVRFAFTVERKAVREPSKAQVVLSNLSPESRALIVDKGCRVVVEAGYTGQSGAIFIGTSYSVKHAHVGPDWSTTIEAADGGKEVSSAKGAWSFGPGASAARAVAVIAQGLGLPLSSASRINPKPATFLNGYAFAGRTVSALDDVTKATGLRWSVQDGQVQILDDALPGDGFSDVLLSSGSGMIGSPERGERDPRTGKHRVTVRCLINPLIRPERLIVVSSTDAPELSGRYRVIGSKVTGDTHGDDWSMTLDAAPA